MAVTPVAGLVSQVSVGGTSVIAAGANPKGGFITNPASAEDQGLSEAETLYVNAVGAAGIEANGTTFGLAPGQTWSFIPDQTTVTSANASSDGHKFSVVVWY